MKGFKGDKHKTMCCVCNDSFRGQRRKHGRKCLEVSQERGETQKEMLELDVDSLVKSTDDLSVKAAELGS